jgi:hypothetical protein
MIVRRVPGAGSLVWPAVMALVVALGGAGCGPRRYPAREPVSFAHTDGGVEIGAGFNQCPEVTFNVSPSQGELSQPFMVEGAASDSDNDPVTISLQADSGTFSTANQLPATFMCTKPGLITITATVNDGSCQTMKSVMIFCLGTHGGDGGGGAAPDASHQDGGVSGGDGSADGGGMVVTNTCPTESPKGSTDCTDCTNNNCSLAPNPMGTDGCCGLPSVADQLLCIAAAECFSNNNCTVGGDPNRCFCGKADVITMCYAVPGAANGPCVAAVVAAAKKNDLATIKTQFTSPASPLGRAVNLLGCRGSFCGTECGVP